MTHDGEILYLSRADVEAAAISVAAVEAAVEASFAARGTGAARVVPKLAVHTPAGANLHAMPGALPEIAGMKWVGLAAGNAARGLPHIASLVVLNDPATGMPLALMDGTWITAVRTAAVSAVGAKYLARADARSLGMIGCGVQADSHLAALRLRFPLARVTAVSRSRASAERFCALARAQGLEAVVVDEPRQAVAGMDIVVSTVPAAAGLRPFLDPDWLAPGGFASAVDLGRSWIVDRLGRLDLVVTDDREQSQAVAAAGNPALAGPFAADLAELAARQKPGRQSPQQRAMLIFAGLSLCDIAVAALILRAAREKGLGRTLPL